MKPSNLLILSLLVLAACSSPESPKVKAASTTESKKKGLFIPVVRYGPEGFYTGIFQRSKFDELKTSFDNKITICIDSLVDNAAFGHSVVAGNDRPFFGSYMKSGDVFRFMVKEPGTEAHDGRFEFTIDSKSRRLRGLWFANDPSLAVTERKYQLNACSPTYKADSKLPKSLVGTDLYATDSLDEVELLTSDAIKLNASTDDLTPGLLENLYKGDLELIRNAVYARHGYSFKNPRMRILFDNYVSWYVPVSTDVTTELTRLEQKNIELIKRYEAHAEKYYDSFGR